MGKADVLRRQICELGESYAQLAQLISHSSEEESAEGAPRDLPNGELRIADIAQRLCDVCSGIEKMLGTSVTTADSGTSACTSLMGPLLRILVKFSWLFNDVTRPQHERLARLFKENTTLSTLAVDLGMTWALRLRPQDHAEDVGESLTDLITLFCNYICTGDSLAPHPSSMVVLRHKNIRAFMSFTVEMFPKIGPDVAVVESSLQSACVKFWVVTLKSTLKLVGKAHFVSLRNVFAEMSVSLLCEFVDALVQHVQKQERVSAAFLALLFEMERFVKRFVSPDVSRPRSRLLGALFGALTEVLNDLDIEGNPPVQLLGPLVYTSLEDAGRQFILLDFENQVLNIVSLFISRFEKITETALREQGQDTLGNKLQIQLPNPMQRFLELFFVLYGALHRSENLQFASLLAKHFSGPREVATLLGHLHAFEGSPLMRCVAIGVEDLKRFSKFREAVQKQVALANIGEEASAPPQTIHLINGACQKTSIGAGVGPKNGEVQASSLQTSPVAEDEVEAPGTSDPSVEGGTRLPRSQPESWEVEAAQALLDVLDRPGTARVGPAQVASSGVVFDDAGRGDVEQRARWRGLSRRRGRGGGFWHRRRGGAHTHDDTLPEFDDDDWNPSSPPEFIDPADYSEPGMIAVPKESSMPVASTSQNGRAQVNGAEVLTSGVGDVAKTLENGMPLAAHGVSAKRAAPDSSSQCTPNHKVVSKVVALPLARLPEAETARIGAPAHSTGGSRDMNVGLQSPATSFDASRPILVHQALGQQLAAQYATTTGGAGPNLLQAAALAGQPLESSLQAQLAQLMPTLGALGVPAIATAPVITVGNSHLQAPSALGSVETLGLAAPSVPVSGALSLISLDQQSLIAKALSSVDPGAGVALVKVAGPLDITPTLAQTIGSHAPALHDSMNHPGQPSGQQAQLPTKDVLTIGQELLQQGLALTGGAAISSALELGATPISPVGSRFPVQKNMEKIRTSTRHVQIVRMIQRDCEKKAAAKQAHKKPDPPTSKVQSTKQTPPAPEQPFPRKTISGTRVLNSAVVENSLSPTLKVAQTNALSAAAHLHVLPISAVSTGVLASGSPMLSTGIVTVPFSSSQTGAGFQIRQSQLQQPMIGQLATALHNGSPLDHTSASLSQPQSVSGIGGQMLGVSASHGATFGSALAQAQTNQLVAAIQTLHKKPFGGSTSPALIAQGASGANPVDTVVVSTSAVPTIQLASLLLATGMPPHAHQVSIIAGGAATSASAASLVTSSGGSTLPSVPAELLISSLPVAQPSTINGFAAVNPLVVAPQMPAMSVSVTMPSVGLASQMLGDPVQAVAVSASMQQSLAGDTGR